MLIIYWVFSTKLKPGNLRKVMGWNTLVIDIINEIEVRHWFLAKEHWRRL